MTLRTLFLPLALGCLSACTTQPAADLIVRGGTIYTASPTQAVVAAMAVKDGRILYVGDANGTSPFHGSETEVIELEGQMVLPGLIDTHVHPVLALERMTCALEDQNQFNLEQLVTELQHCLTRAGSQAPAPGDWITVSQFNGYGADTPQFLGRFHSLKEGLNAVSNQHKLFLSGADGHVYGVNDYALEHGATLNGRAIAVNARTLADELREYAVYFATDAQGEPNGIVKDAGAYDLFDYARESDASLIARVDDFNHLFLSAGITGAMEAWAAPQDVAVYEGLAKSGKLRPRIALAPAIARDRHMDRDGRLRLRVFMDWALETRERLEQYPGLDVPSIKVMLDGVAEHPTLTAAMKTPYLQPRINDDGTLQYPASALSGCDVSNCGVIELNQPDLNAAVLAADQAGFSVHFHALGDRAVDSALTAVEFAREQNPSSRLYHNLSHIQQVDRRDIARFGAARVAVTPTLSWLAPWYAYDISVIPYRDQHQNLNDLEALYDDKRPYMQQLYPLRSLKAAGALISAGSDIPVDASRLRPFTDIQYGLLRAERVSTDRSATSTWVSLNAQERLPIRDLLDAYTINAAKALGWDGQTGSLEVGKSADFIIINQDIIRAAETARLIDESNIVNSDAYGICDEHSAEHCRTRVLSTYIAGAAVYRRSN